MDVKKSLKDSRFRESLPDSFKKKYSKELIEFLNNPGCGCNVPLYRAILKEAPEQLRAYYPGREVLNEKEEAEKLAENNWTVINCKVDELEDRLRRLSKGRKQIAVSRFEDQVTVIVNELDILF